MKPLFTIHHGEFLVGEIIEREQHLKNANIWLPSKDSGIDLLLTDKGNAKQNVSLQVKYSRNYVDADFKDVFPNNIKSAGWWKLKRETLQKTKADYWIFIIQGYKKSDQNVIIIKPQLLLNKMNKIYGYSSEYIHVYFGIEEMGKENKKQKCVEIRSSKDAKINSKHPRNFSDYLNNWKPIINQLKLK